MRAVKPYYVRHKDDDGEPPVWTLEKHYADAAESDRRCVARAREAGGYTPGGETVVDVSDLPAGGSVMPGPSSSHQKESEP